MSKGKRPSAKKKDDVVDLKKVNNVIKDEVEKIVDDSVNTTNSWEELDKIYEAQAVAIVTIASEINKIHSHPDFLESVENKDEAIITLTGFKKDIETLTTDLIGIHALHQHRSGPINNEKDLLDSLNIFDDYTNFQNRFDACIEPILDILTDINIEANFNKLEKELANNEDKPNE